MKELHSINRPKITNQQLSDLNLCLSFEDFEKLKKEEINYIKDFYIFYTFKFENGCEIDIEISSGSSNYFGSMTLYNEDDTELCFVDICEISNHMEFLSDDNIKYICDFDVEDLS